jgi:beta-lactamase class A
MMRHRVALLFAAALTALPLRSSAQEPAAAPAPSSASIPDAQIRAAIGDFKGSVTLFAKNLETGETYGIGEDERVRTASTIKLPIMIEAFAQVAEGKIKWDQTIVLTKDQRVGGAGILMEFHDGLQITLRDAVNLMIVVSDNTATNLVLDIVTTDAVNDRMESLGLTHTRSLRKVMGKGGESRAGADPANKGFGLGVATPREMVRLLELLDKGAIVSKEASAEMIAILKRQQHRDGIGRSLRGATIATKSGALDALRSDVGIVYTKTGKIALAISCDKMPEVIWNEENPGSVLIGRLTTLLVEGLTAKR